MGARVAGGGGGGFAGGALLRLLPSHPDLQLGPVTADSNAGRPITEVHPQLAGVPSLAGRCFDAADPADPGGPAGALPGDGCDLAFLALPAGHSAPLAGRLGQDIKVVDLGPDFR